MTMPPTTYLALPSTALRDHFKQHRNVALQRNVPRLNESLLKRARNCVPRSEDNNDLLEFIGDRCVNLICAILVEDVKLSAAHHQTVSRRVSTNDTFGRVAYCLRFHEYAELVPKDRESVDEWDPHLSEKTPPKVLADLFEAYAGAVFVQHGWKRLRTWLERIFEPIIKLATADYWFTNSGERIFRETVACRWRNIQPDSRIKAENRLFDHIDCKRRCLEDKGREAIDMLPADTIFCFDTKGHLRAPDCERMEVAERLVDMWICQIVIEHWPEYHQAKAKAAHMLSGITALVTSERVMGHLAKRLALHSVCKSSTELPKPTLGPYQRTSILQATIGWMYRKDASATDAWGKACFTSIVLRAHDILMSEHGYRPLISRARSTTPEPTKDSTQSDHDDVLSSLIQGLGSLDIKSSSKSQPKPATVVSITTICNSLTSLSVDINTVHLTSGGHSETSISSKPAQASTFGTNTQTTKSRLFPHQVQSTTLALSKKPPEAALVRKPSTTVHACEAPGNAKWKPIGATKGGFSPWCSTDHTRSDETKSSSKLVVATKHPGDKENNASKGIPQEKKSNLTSTDSVAQKFTTLTSGSFNPRTAMFLPRSVRVKAKARALIPS